MRLAESKQDLLYVIKSNALKRKCNESEADLRVLEKKRKGKFYAKKEKKNFR